MLRAVAPGALSGIAVPGLSYGVLATSAGSVTTAGTVYVPGDSVTLTGGSATTNAVLVITDTKVISATVNAGGSGGSNGAVTITGTTGTGTPFQATGTISGGALTGALVVTVAGDYTVNPTSLAAEPVTGGSLSGATVTVVMGAMSFAVNNPGVYTAIPGSPATMAQGSTSGGGTGATFPISFGPLAAGLIAPTLAVGLGNLFIGAEQPAATLTGVESTHIGDRAGGGATGASSFNLVGGHNALGIGGTGGVASSMVVLGCDALRNWAGTISATVAVGTNVLKNSAQGGWSGQTAVGENALLNWNGNNSNPNNTALGLSAASGASGATFIGVTALGQGTGTALTNGSNHVFAGNSAGNKATTASNGTVLGFTVGSTTWQTGSHVILIGTNSSLDAPAAATSNYIGIGAGSTAVISATGCGTPSTSTTTIAGSLVVTGGQGAAGGFSVSPRLFHTGGVTALSAASSYTSQTPVATEFYFAEVYVDANCTITGAAVFNSATISGNMKVGLFDSAGNNVATSASTAMSGTSAYQRVPFTGTYAAKGPATYYVGVFYDNATARPNTFTSGNFGVGNKTAQTFSTGFTAITPPTTFTTALGPVASLY